MSETATAEAAAGAAEVLIVTEAARATVLDIRAKEDDGELLGLRVEVTGASGVDYTYDLSLEPIAEADDDAFVREHEGLTVIVPAASVAALTGATLDLPSVPGQGGLVPTLRHRPRTGTDGAATMRR